MSLSLWGMRVEEHIRSSTKRHLEHFGMPLKNGEIHFVVDGPETCVRCIGFDQERQFVDLARVGKSVQSGKYGRTWAVVRVLVEPAWVLIKAAIKTTLSFSNIVSMGSFAVAHHAVPNSCAGRVKSIGCSCLGILATPLAMMVNVVVAISHVIRPTVNYLDLFEEHLWSGFVGARRENASHRGRVDRLVPQVDVHRHPLCLGGISFSEIMIQGFKVGKPSGTPEIAPFVYLARYTSKRQGSLHQYEELPDSHLPTGVVRLNVPQRPEKQVDALIQASISFFEDIDVKRQQCTPVLICCEEDPFRALAVAMAYVMYKYQMNQNEAWECMKLHGCVQDL